MHTIALGENHIFVNNKSYQNHITRTFTMDNRPINYEAWLCLDDALFTSSHIKAKDLEIGSTEWQNVYPTSLEETNRMEELINEALSKAEDPNEPMFKERVDELKEIVEYSRSKQRTWKWQLILGAIIAICIFWYFSSSAQDDVKKSQKKIAQIEAWTECDTTISYKALATEQLDNMALYDRQLLSANDYKIYKLYCNKIEAESAQKSVESYKANADTASTDERKKSYLESQKESEERYKKYTEKYEEISSLKFEDIKDMALKEFEDETEYFNSKANSKIFWTIYLIVLIPLYIISGYPYGYLISKHRRQHNLMGGIRKWGFRIAAFFFGAGLAMSLLPDDIVKYHYSNGHTETRSEFNGANFLIIGMKIGLMLVGLILFCFISILIMTIETITGLKRNFNWKEILDKKQRSNELKQ